MSTPSPLPLRASVEHQRKLAKDLIRAARAGDPAALARIHAVRAGDGSPSRTLALADAQLAIAREAGFASWPKLVSDFQERDVKAFCDAIRAGDVARTQQLLASSHVRQRINDPMFDFGQRAAHIAAKNEAMLTMLIDAGADVNLKSDWENGPYTVLDNANDRTARFLLAHGAALTPNVAARLGWFDELRALVDADASLVHARGGDGQQPLHEAKTVAIADFLLARGAGIDVRCIDHHSTAAQYALVDRPDVCRRLLERGATPDIFMAARLGDVPLATRLLDSDPGCVDARINDPGYPPVPPFNIYCWTLGFGLSPHAVARSSVIATCTICSWRGARGELASSMRSWPRTNQWRAAMLAEQPSLLASLTPEEHGHLAHAIFQERFDAADLMLRLGFDPAAARRGRRKCASRGVLGRQRADGRTAAGTRRRADRRPRSVASKHPARVGGLRFSASPRRRRGLRGASSSGSLLPVRM